MTPTDAIDTPAAVVDLLERLQTLDAVLGSGVCFGNYMVVFRHQAHYPLRRDQAKVVWRTVRETFERLQSSGMAADRVNWRFGGLRLYAVYRQSLAIGVIMDPKAPESSLQAVQEVMESVCSQRLAA